MLKILQVRLQQYVNWELPDVQAEFRKGRGTRDKIANILWQFEKAREFQKHIYFCFIDHAKALDCVDHNKLWNTLNEMGIPEHLTCLLRNPYAGQEATELDMEYQTNSKLAKKYTKAVYCHLAYLTSMESTSCKMPDWIKHKLDSRLQGDIQIPQISRWYHFNSSKKRGIKEPVDDGERGEWKSWLKTQHSEN